VRSLLSAVPLAAAAAVVGCVCLVGDAPPRLCETANPPPKGIVADNSRCHVCHLNYADEKMAVAHVKANISCEGCHGPSDAHCADEGHRTPPDTMFPKARINPSCIHCHPKEKLTGDLAHEPILAGSATTFRLCTDCHGTHRLAFREVRWDKATGKLLPYEEASD
jgi:hypothetical protein